MLTRHILLVLHIACIAAWFGGSLSISGRIRRGLGLGDAEARFTIGEINRTLRLSLMFGFLTLVTGLLLVFQAGGFKDVPKAIHMGLGLTLVMLVLEGVIIRSAWSGMEKVILQGGDRSMLKSQRVRLSISSGVEQLLWLAVLVLMVMKF